MINVGKVRKGRNPKYYQNLRKRSIPFKSKDYRLGYKYVPIQFNNNWIPKRTAQDFMIDLINLFSKF